MIIYAIRSALVLCNIWHFLHICKIWHSFQECKSLSLLEALMLSVSVQLYTCEIGDLDVRFTSVCNYQLKTIFKFHQHQPKKPQ